MPNNRNLRDVLLKVTKALPASTTAAVSTGIDTQNSANGDFVAEVEFLLSAPVLTTGELPDTKTMTYTIEHDTDSAFGTVATLLTVPTVQTGSTGAAAFTYRFVPPSTCKRYVRAKVTPSASGTGDASGKSMTLEVLS